MENSEPWKSWNIPEEKWNDWKWQVENRITSLAALKPLINLSDAESDAINKTLNRFRMAITPYYASLMDKNNPQCPIRLQAVPRIEETYKNEDDLADPLGEVKDSKTSCLVHRYPDRVLFLVTDKCGMYCRHCTRRRMVGATDGHTHSDKIENALEYIKAHTEIRDVLLSGGDPLVLNDSYLESLIKKVREIPHVEIIRIGTRAPVTFPQRITPGLVSMLSKYHPIYINTHFNHPKEFTPESEKALAMLADAGIPLGNQSVLLRGINDCSNIMKKLVHKLLQNRVKPYYMYVCDLSQGIGHFRTTVKKGIEIIENLRGHTTGMAIPTFVVDAPGGGGKIPVSPSYLMSMNDNKVKLRNYEWGIFDYIEPRHEYKECDCEYCKDKKCNEHNSILK